MIFTAWTSVSQRNSKWQRQGSSREREKRQEWGTPYSFLRQCWSGENPWIHIPKCSGLGCVQSPWMTCPFFCSCPCPIAVLQTPTFPSSCQCLALRTPAWLALRPASHVRPCSQMCCLPAQPPLLSHFSLSYQIPFSISLLTLHQLFKADSGFPSLSLFSLFPSY